MFNLANHFKELDVADGSVIADFGCGVGASAIKLVRFFPNCVICGVDIDKSALDHFQANLSAEDEKVKERIKIIRADLEDETTNPIPEQTFDAAILENVLHTVIHKKACIWNLKLMMKDGGKILVSDFHTSPLKTANHQNMLLQQKDVERLFVEAGFLVYPIGENDKHSYNFIAKKPDGRMVNISHKYESK